MVTRKNPFIIEWIDQYDYKIHNTYNLYKKDDVTTNRLLRIVTQIIVDCITKSGLTDNKTTRITVLYYSCIHVHSYMYNTLI